MPDIDVTGMSSAPNPQSDIDLLEAAADQAIAACGGDTHEAVKALIVASQFLVPNWKNCVLRSRQVIREENYLRHPRRCYLAGRMV